MRFVIRRSWQNAWRKCRRLTLKGDQDALHGAARQAKSLSKLCDRCVGVRTPSLSNASHWPARIKRTSIFQLSNRLGLAHPRTDGSLNIRRLRIDASVQLTADFAQHAARLHLCNGTPRTESSQEIKDLSVALPYDHTTSTTNTKGSWESHLREGMQEQFCLVLRDHQLQMDSPSCKGERAPS